MIYAKMRKETNAMITEAAEIMDVEQAPIVRQAFIPDDLSYMAETEFGQEMLRLAAEVVEEQGTCTTEEINQLIDLIRGGVSINADLP